MTEDIVINWVIYDFIIKKSYELNIKILYLFNKVYILKNNHNI